MSFYTLTVNAWTVGLAEIATQIEVTSFQGCFSMQVAFPFTLLPTKLHFHFSEESYITPTSLKKLSPQVDVVLISLVIIELH